MAVALFSFHQQRQSSCFSTMAGGIIRLSNFSHWLLIVNLICIAPVTNYFKHLLLCLFATYIFHLAKYLFKSLPFPVGFVLCIIEL